MLCRNNGCSCLVFFLSFGEIMGALVFALFSLWSLLQAASALPLCTDSRAPFTANSSLTFCPYNGTICCNGREDLRLERRFRGMNISDPACASLLKSILCASCDQFSAELFRIKLRPRSVPVLCNSTAQVNSSQSKYATNDFCSKVWNTCQDVPIWNSPFAPSLQGSAGVPTNSTSSKLTDLWQSHNDFCQAFGGSSSSGSLCFDGEPVKLNNTQTQIPPSGLCIERIGNGSYLNMAAHPDGSDRAFFSDQPGKIWLGTVPAQGSGGVLEVDQSSPFLDLTDEVHYDTQFGLMGLAFHPDFSRNGRFFVSFNCDKADWASCSGRCACNSDVGCDPSKLDPDNGAEPCQYNSVVAEFTVNGTSSTPSSATSANPSEVRRIFTMGLPFISSHGGQILFGPSDGYLYFMMGDGGNRGDPFNFSQNKKSLLGKIMRLDVDNIPSATQINNLDLWGSYSIPRDNPSVDDSGLQPEIWALGLRNPWRCSFDWERPSYFFCGDVGQEVYEEVDLITKDGNYGWRVYEGPNLYTPLQTPGGNTTPGSINAIFPIMGYYHSDVNKKEGSASIIGGYMYRSLTNPCMYGRYLYADLYAVAMWAGIENPKDSGNFSSTKIPFSCARDSPLSCTILPGSSLPSLGYIYSFGEDNRKDVYLLTSTGVYRVVRPSRCSFSCSKENVSASANPAPSPSSSTASKLDLMKKWITLFSSFLLLVGFFF
ncbi:GSDH domain-containing protein [Cinnamomum micranthum f. kanehirae]|uniref:GSDH domain-containing protein n=1 Tax=Cinnamomum micranthum f. kanehirae TaxID=337451 RepID=A0A3S3PVP6_9MAGN|nr:GSDH domain-containing protein [Cinnamomum micranthum f. kanehirae]